MGRTLLSDAFDFDFDLNIHVRKLDRRPKDFPKSKSTSQASDRSVRPTLITSGSSNIP
jgi:hypothetical protein